MVSFIFLGSEWLRGTACLLGSGGFGGGEGEGKLSPQVQCGSILDFTRPEAPGLGGHMGSAVRFRLRLGDLFR